MEDEIEKKHCFDGRYAVYLPMLFLSFIAVSACAAPINPGTESSLGLLSTKSGWSVINCEAGISSALAAGAAATVIPLGMDQVFHDALNPVISAGYHFPPSGFLTGKPQLRSQGDLNADWVFQMGRTPTTSDDSIMEIIKSAKKCPVSWREGLPGYMSNVFDDDLRTLDRMTLNRSTLHGRGRNCAVGNGSSDNQGADLISVPEVSSVALAMLGLPTALLFRRRK
jgi:hypothetical protein